jgi:molybdate transport system ATP-binding protein
MMDVVLQKSLHGAEGAFSLEVALEIPPQAMVAIMGASGAGKTSLLKMMAGLMVPDAGKIVVDGNVWFHAERKISTQPQSRSVGYVFQEYALFPNMSLRENLLFAVGKRGEKKIVGELMELMGLTVLQDRKPTHLSGGQQQRVALARAIVRRPKLLLLDEPFAALDKPMRQRLQQDLKMLHEHYGTTTLLVSHDPVEVARLAHEVVVLDNGKVAKQGPPFEVLHNAEEDGAFEGEILAINRKKHEIGIVSENIFHVVSVADSLLDTLVVGSKIRVNAGEVEMRKA